MKCSVCDGTGRTPSPTGMPMIGATSCAGCFGAGTRPAPSTPPVHTCGAINTPCEHPLCAPAPSTPGEGTGRPDHVWLDGRCIALHVPKGTRYAVSDNGPEAVAQSDDGKTGPVCVIRWADGTTPAPPASPVPPTRPDTVCDCCGAHRVTGWAGVCEPCWTYICAMPPAAAAPTPTPCPYIVTGGEGTSHCSLAERSAMHAAAPPSTPADPRPTDPTGSEA